MQFQILTSILALGITTAAAAPSENLTPRQAPWVTELQRYSSTGCLEANRIGSFFPLRTPGCQAVPAGTWTAMVAIDLPRGCSLKVYPTDNCSGTQVIEVPRTSPVRNCLEMGNGQQVGSVEAVGTCEA